MEKIWKCKIGGEVGDLPAGADGPMRRAVQIAFETLTGVEASFTFSGWGATLTEVERAVHENRAPNCGAMQEAIDAGDGTLHGAIEYWHEEALRLRAEVANRNQRALDGDKAKAAFDNVFDENERLRAEVQHLRTGWITLQIDIGDLIPAIDGERANDPMINRVKRVVTELTEAKEALRLCVDVIQHISYAWQGQGTHPQTAINAAMRLYEKEGK